MERIAFGLAGERQRSLTRFQYQFTSKRQILKHGGPTVVKTQTPEHASHGICIVRILWFFAVKATHELKTPFAKFNGFPGSQHRSGLPQHRTMLGGHTTFR